MPTFANTINGNEILAKRSQCDYAGNDLQTTYATKSEVAALPTNLTAAQVQALKEALGVDETVLWSGTAVMSNNPSLTLSESAMNFKFIDIYSLPHGTNDIAIITRIYTETLSGDTDAQGSFTVTGHAGGGGFRINNAYLRIVNYTTMTFTEQKQTSLIDTAVTTANAANSIIKVVGIHRIASN